jgi:hypothetical protein
MLKLLEMNIAVGIFKETSSNDDVPTIYTISSTILYASFC